MSPVWPKLISFTLKERKLGLLLYFFFILSNQEWEVKTRGLSEVFWTGISQMAKKPGQKSLKDIWASPVPLLGSDALTLTLFLANWQFSGRTDTDWHVLKYSLRCCPLETKNYPGLLHCWLFEVQLSCPLGTSSLQGSSFECWMLVEIFPD